MAPSNVLSMAQLRTLPLADQIKILMKNGGCLWVLIGSSTSRVGDRLRTGGEARGSFCSLLGAVQFYSFDGTWRPLKGRAPRTSPAV